MPRYSTKRNPKSKQQKNFLPLWLSLFGLILVMIAAWAVMSRDAEKNANIEVKGEPRLKVDKTVIDRGDVKLGIPVYDEVRVTNVGGQTLRFTEAPYVELRQGC